MVRHNLSRGSGRMLKIDQAPTLANARIHTHVTSVVNEIELFNGKAIGHVKIFARQYKLARSVIAIVPCHALEQWNQVPSLVFLAHVEPQTCVRFVQCKLDEGFDSEVDTLTRLVPVAIEDKEHILRQAESFTRLFLLHRKERARINAMGNNVTRRFATSLPHFLKAKLRVSGHAVPFFARLKHFWEEAVAIHWEIAIPLKTKLLLQRLGHAPKVVQNPNIIYGKHKIRLLRSEDTRETMGAKRIGATSNSRIHAIGQISGVAPPVCTHCYNFVLFAKLLQQRFANATEASLNGKVAAVQNLGHERKQACPILGSFSTQAHSIQRHACIPRGICN